MNREITEEESTLLKETALGATFGSDTLPTDASVPVTKLDFDDDVSPTLAESIEAALAAVTSIPELRVPGLTVEPVVKPAAEQEGVIEGDLADEDPVTEDAAAGN
ncbi:hypothetical protein Abr02nite_74850 [Paractinoplanes brasiliensis]|nr:hypothetical protein Abr02nite_74850 [Actinoplanes brasiliensis]